MTLIVRLIVNAIALAVATWLLDGITLLGDTDKDKALTLIIVAVIFGVVNAIVRPIVKLLTFPLILLTLGLLVFVINALMLMLTSWITDKLDVAFHVDGFGTALLGALIITAVGWVLDLILPDKLMS
jgi:putative membrane protein